MEALKQWLLNGGSNLIALVITSSVIMIFSAIANRIKDPKLKKIMQIIPRAIIYAEKMGGSGNEKLAIAIDYVKSTGVCTNSDKITNYIEDYLILTKNVNISTSSGNSSNSTSGGNSSNSTSSGNSSNSICTR